MTTIVLLVVYILQFKVTCDDNNTYGVIRRFAFRNENETRRNFDILIQNFPKKAFKISLENARETWEKFRRKISSCAYI